MKFFSSDGIVIKKVDYGEADRVITLFTQKYGKVDLLIKGIRKSKRRDRNAVELLAVSKFIFYRKGERIIVSDFELKESFWGIRGSASKIEIIMYLLSVLNSILVENQRKSSLYSYFLKLLEYINKSEDYVKNHLLICYFLNKIIKEEGIGFELSDGEFFDIEHSRTTKVKGSYFFRLSKKEKDILISLSGGREKAYSARTEDVEVIKKVINILEKYINYHLHTKLNFKHFLGEDLKNG